METAGSSIVLKDDKSSLADPSGEGMVEVEGGDEPEPA